MENKIHNTMHRQLKKESVSKDQICNIMKHTVGLDIINNEAMKEEFGQLYKTHKISVSWTETGTILMDGKDLEDAIKKAQETADDISLPEGEYLDGSFKVDEDTTRIMNEVYEYED